LTVKTDNNELKVFRTILAGYGDMIGDC